MPSQAWVSLRRNLDLHRMERIKCPHRLASLHCKWRGGRELYQLLSFLLPWIPLLNFSPPWFTIHSGPIFQRKLTTFKQWELPQIKGRNELWMVKVIAKDIKQRFILRIYKNSVKKKKAKALDSDNSLCPCPRPLLSLTGSPHMSKRNYSKVEVGLIHHPAQWAVLSD